MQAAKASSTAWSNSKFNPENIGHWQTFTEDSNTEENKFNTELKFTKHSIKQSEVKDNNQNLQELNQTVWETIGHIVRVLNQEEDTEVKLVIQTWYEDLLKKKRHKTIIGTNYYCSVLNLW